MSRYFKVSWAYLRKLAYLALLIRKKAAPYLFTRFQKACGKITTLGTVPKWKRSQVGSYSQRFLARAFRFIKVGRVGWVEPGSINLLGWALRQAKPISCNSQGVRMLG
jgi:hypothetical protein